MVKLPRFVRLIIGYSRSLYGGVVRSEAAQRRHIVRSEYDWCGKRLSPAELDEFIQDQRPGWRRSSV